MRIRVTPTRMWVEDAHPIARPHETFYLPPSTGHAAELHGVGAGDLEQALSARGTSYLVLDQNRLRIEADHRGRHHLYLHRVEGADEPELTVTDDPFSFAGTLPIDRNVARLVPLMKFVPPPLCLLQGAERLAAGAFRVYDRRTLRATENGSRLAELYRPDARPATHEDIRCTLAALAAEAAATDPPPVVFLSGGSDSALLVHLLGRCGLPPATWTAVFDTPVGRREGRLAEVAAAHYDAPWRAVMIDKAVTLEHLPAILAGMQEPFADVALVPEAILALLMRRQMGDSPGPIAVFEGEGMDSLMCGSYKFVAEHYRPWLAPLLAAIPSGTLGNPDRRSVKGALALKIAQSRALLGGGSPFERHLRFLLDDDFVGHVPAALREDVAAAFRTHYDLFPELDDVNRLAMMTFQGNIPNLENRKLAVVAACARLEFHLIYQDPRFIRLALSIPARRKIGMGYGKRIVKEAFRDVLPEHALTRRKSSFVPPVIDWIHPEHEELLLGSDLFDGDEVRHRLRMHLAGREDHLAFLWGLLVTNAWIRRYEGAAARPHHRPPPPWVSWQHPH